MEFKYLKIRRDSNRESLKKSNFCSAVRLHSCCNNKDNMREVQLNRR